jgi:hypothetical protein
MHRVLPPGGLRKKTREMRVVGALQDAARNTGYALVGQDDQPGQIVLEMPTLALVVKQVAEDRSVVGDHGSGRHDWHFHHAPPCPYSAYSAGFKGSMLTLTWQITTVENGVDSAEDHAFEVW